MSIFAFDPVKYELHICLDCTRSKSNGIDVIPPMPNGRSLASTKGTAIFLQKYFILPVTQSKDRLAYFSEESEAQSYQVLVPCSTAGYLSAPMFKCMADLEPFSSLVG